MQFDYAREPGSPSGAFPNKTEVLRPSIDITVKYGEESIDTSALIDSGADFCMFPYEVGEVLLIHVESGKDESIRGVGNISYPVFFHNVTIIVGGHVLEVFSGFGKCIPRPLLGQLGFFDRYSVKFELSKRRIIIS